MNRIFLLLISTFLIFSCGKDEEQVPDPCTGITCENGNCVNGQCACDEGWTGPDCSQRVDLCEGVSCVNGDCVNGQCDCDEGWTGPDCSDILTPRSINIIAVEIENIPTQKEDGTNWDILDAPDIFFFFSINSQIYGLPSSTKENCSDSEFLFTYAEPQVFPVSDLEDEILQISFWDEDGVSASDLMVFARFERDFYNQGIDNTLITTTDFITGMSPTSITMLISYNY